MVKFKNHPFRINTSKITKRNKIVAEKKFHTQPLRSGALKSLAYHVENITYEDKLKGRLSERNLWCLRMFNEISSRIPQDN